MAGDTHGAEETDARNGPEPQTQGREAGDTASGPQQVAGDDFEAQLAAKGQEDSQAVGTGGEGGKGRRGHSGAKRADRDPEAADRQRVGGVRAQGGGSPRRMGGPGPQGRLRRDRGRTDSRNSRGVLVALRRSKVQPGATSQAASHTFCGTTELEPTGTAGAASRAGRASRGSRKGGFASIGSLTVMHPGRSEFPQALATWPQDIVRGDYLPALSPARLPQCGLPVTPVAS